MSHLTELNLTKPSFVSNKNTLLPLHESAAPNVITSNNIGVNLLHLFNGILDVNIKNVEENFWF